MPWGAVCFTCPHLSPLGAPPPMALYEVGRGAVSPVVSLGGAAVLGMACSSSLWGDSCLSWCVCMAVREGTAAGCGIGLFRVPPVSTVTFFMHCKAALNSGVLGVYRCCIPELGIPVILLLVVIGLPPPEVGCGAAPPPFGLGDVAVLSLVCAIFL